MGVAVRAWSATSVFRSVSIWAFDPRVSFVHSLEDYPQTPQALNFRSDPEKLVGSLKKS